MLRITTNWSTIGCRGIKKYVLKNCFLTTLLTVTSDQEIWHWQAAVATSRKK